MSMPLYTLTPILCVVQKDNVVWAPGVLFGVINLLILIPIRLLPDSMGRELPQTLRDLETWYEEPEEKKGDKGTKTTAGNAQN